MNLKIILANNRGKNKLREVAAKHVSPQAKRKEEKNLQYSNPRKRLQYEARLVKELFFGVGMYIWSEDHLPKTLINQSSKPAAAAVDAAPTRKLFPLSELWNKLAWRAASLRRELPIS